MTNGNFKGHVDDNGRTCTKCGEYKVWSEFNKNKSISTGYRSSCRECDRKTEAAYTRDKAKVYEASHRWYQNNKERHAQINRKWQQNNKEKLAASQREYYYRNREKILEYQRQYYAKKKNQGE